MGGNVKQFIHCGKQYGGSSKINRTLCPHPVMPLLDIYPV
jgi:hypothetical protein